MTSREGFSYASLLPELTSAGKTARPFQGENRPTDLSRQFCALSGERLWYSHEAKTENAPVSECLTEWPGIRGWL